MVSLEQVLQSASLNSGIEYLKLREQVIDPLKAADHHIVGRNFVPNNMHVRNYYWPKNRGQARKIISGSS